MVRSEPSGFASLVSMSAGSYKVAASKPWWKWWLPCKRAGWLTLTKYSDGCASVLWTTDQHSHYPHGNCGPAKAVLLAANGDLIAYFESAISMWVKWGYGRGGDAELSRAIEFADWAMRVDKTYIDSGKKHA
jgi:hypothetical protein